MANKYEKYDEELEGPQLPYLDALRDEGYSAEDAVKMARVIGKLQHQGYEPYLTPTGGARTPDQAIENKLRGKGSLGSAHVGKKAVDVGFMKDGKPVEKPGWRTTDAYRQAVDEEGGLIYGPDVRPGDVAHMEVYDGATFKGGPRKGQKKGYYDDAPVRARLSELGFDKLSRSRQLSQNIGSRKQSVLDAINQKRQAEADSAINAVKQRKAAELTQNVRQMTETNEYNTEPSPDKVRRLQALADAGYLGVQEYSNPEQKQAVYLPGSGMGGGMLSSGGADVAKVVGEIGKGAKGVLKRTVGVFKGMPGKRGHAETYPQFVGDKPPPGKRNWTTSKSEAEGYAKQYEGDVVKSELPAEALDKMAKGRADLGYDEYLIPESVISPEGVAASKGRPAAASKAQSKLDAFYNQRLKLDRSFKKAREEYIMSLAGEKGWPKGGKGRGK